MVALFLSQRECLEKKTTKKLSLTHMESFLSLLNSVDISNHSELETIAVGTGQQNRDCDALFQSGTTTSGVQTIAVRGNSLEVYCQMNTHGHNWIVSSECTVAVY